MNALEKYNKMLGQSNVKMAVESCSKLCDGNTLSETTAFGTCLNTCAKAYIASWAINLPERQANQ